MVSPQPLPEKRLPDNQSSVFGSYSREDSAFALKLISDLRSSGASVWLDQLDIFTGVRWDTEIEVALARCTAFLVILSPASVATENVRDEIDFAINQRKNYSRPAS